MCEALHVSSLLIRAHPKALQEVQDAINRRNGAEVALTEAGGKIIVTLESESEAEIVDCLHSFGLLDGVVSTALVYHEVIENTKENLDGSTP